MKTYRLLKILFLILLGSQISYGYYTLVLNEYNAVSSSNFLKLDGNDTYFGRVAGNGGSWIELVVTSTHLNLQNASIKIKEDGNEIFSAKIPEFLSLASLRKGTILTISNEPTDMSYNPFNAFSDDWKLNINIDDLEDKIGTFRLSSNNSDITIISEDGTKTRLSTSGEGIGDDIIDNQEVYKLKTNPNKRISPSNEHYGDDNDGEAISTFGSENQWIDENGILQTQRITIKEGEDLNETEGLVLSNISDLDSLKDAEALLYIPQNNSLWITDDDSHQVFEMDFTTHEVKNIFNDTDLGTFTNGEIEDHCSNHHGPCDIEEVAYNENSDTLYIFLGHSPGTPIVYKLTRDTINDPFVLNDYRVLDPQTEYPSAIFIDNQFIVSVGKKLYLYDFETNTIGENPIFEMNDDVGDFVGLAYSNGTLWITTISSYSRLIKVNWQTKTVENIYKMKNNGVSDPRGVEIINNRLYILDGYDNIKRYHVLRHAIHIYQIP